MHWRFVKTLLLCGLLVAMAGCSAVLPGDQGEAVNRPGAAGGNGQGNPVVPLEGDVRKCHDAIGKNKTKHFSTVVKERAKCQKAAELAGECDTDDCSGADPKGKIDKKRTKGEGKVEGACAAVSLELLDSCEYSQRPAGCVTETIQQSQQIEMEAGIVKKVGIEIA